MSRVRRAKIHDDFRGPILDTRTWVDHYLPQWTEPHRSLARYDFDAQGLRLRIDADQLPWLDADGSWRVSNIQTGLHSGPVGSVVGTHRHRDDLVVVTPQSLEPLWTPLEGEVSVTVSATADPTCMVAIWLVGFERDDQAESGEMCVAELFGDKIGRDSSTVRVGIKAHRDPRLVDDVRDVTLPIDATEPHTYSVRWSEDGVEFAVDGQIIMTSAQRLTYEQQLMIDLFEFPVTDERDPRAYPKTAVVHSVIGSGIVAP